MIGHINIGRHRLTFVFRHRFEKRNEDDAVEKFRARMEWKTFNLGLWYKPTKIVGRKNFHAPSEWKNNLVRSHMLGINLLLCKAWIEYSKSGMHIDIEKKSHKDFDLL